MIEQLTIFDIMGIKDEIADKADYIVEAFSADGFCLESKRQELEKKYEPILEVTGKFDRRSVSYQLSKKDALHSWLKYKEGFSADLVNRLLDDMDAKPGDTVMDPFLGSGTTAIVCQMRGINSVGYDVLPLSGLSIAAKASVMRYKVEELEKLLEEFSNLSLPADYHKRTPYIRITESAYPEYNERFINYSTEWIYSGGYSEEVKRLFLLCVMNCLELCSYTSKSGQYLRWDSRSQKVIDANTARVAAGRKPLPEYHCRKEIGNIKDAVMEELRHVIADIRLIQSAGLPPSNAVIDYKQSSVLYELPKMKDNTIKGVITSPPYCNRYDYTRTYALELVYLGLDEKGIRDLRQSLLSCTVENKSKTERLRKYYERIGALERFEAIYNIIQENAAFSEIQQALNKRREHGDLNNNGVIRMVVGYFFELAFVFAELYRVCRKGALVAIVNDNVRYGGEVIPVDCLSTSFAEQFGFKPVKIYCLKQQKGNSSQQMAKYGRVPLRKSITIWKKE